MSAIAKQKRSVSGVVELTDLPYRIDGGDANGAKGHANGVSVVGNMCVALFKSVV